MNKQKIISLILLTLLVISSLITPVQAVNGNLDLERTTGSLTITKYETGRKDEDGNYLPLAGVKFDIYKIGDDETSTETPTDESILATKQTATTGANGRVSFTNLPLGRYLVVEAEAPENVVSKIANFIVDIPMTINNGTRLNYDVEVSPKNNTVYGGFVLHKIDEMGDPLGGVEFQLQQYNSTTGVWEDYGPILETTSHMEKSMAAPELGTITVTGLPAGKYRFIETEALEGYILDNYTTYDFEVSMDVDGSTKVEPETITVQNDKPEITKEITTELTNGSINIGEDIEFKIVTDVPSTIDRLNTYTVEDILSEGLTINQSSLEINGVDSDEVKTKLGADDYTANYNETDRKLTITFTNANLTNYETLEMTYNAKLNDEADATIEGNANVAKLTYSTIVKTKYDETPNTETTNTVEDEENVTTGGFWIEKRALNQTGELLQGAKFKIATSEANAKAGNYISKPDGTDLTLTTGVDGQVSYKGLAYGTYWLVEIEAPTYEENGKTKNYNLLRAPVDVEVTENTYTSTTPTKVIVNKKGFELPNTGGMGTATIISVGLIIMAVGVIFYKKDKEE